MSTRLFRCAMLAAAVIAQSGLLSIPSHAQGPVTVVGSSDWTVDFARLEANENIRRGDPIFVVPVLPGGLFVASSSAIDSDTGAQVLAQGQQLVAHMSGPNQRDYCTTSDLGFMNNSIFRCFVDADGDGQLESHFRVLSRILSESPIVDSGKIGALETMSPVAFIPADPSDIDNPMALEVRWIAGNGEVDGDFIVEVSLNANSGRRLRFEQRIAIQGKGGRRVASLFGVNFECRVGERRQATCTSVAQTASMRMRVVGTGVTFLEAN